MINARFYVREITQFANGNGYADPAPRITVKLSPVSGSRGEQNKTWASATPSGEISMTIGNPAAAAWFAERLGQDIAVTFGDRPVSET
jgi:hypothetical protein